MNHGPWPLRVVAAAAEMKPRALRQIFDTHILKFRGDDQRSTGTGTPVRLSKNRAYEAAILQQAKRLGLSPSRAALAAFEFTINGTTERPAGSLFEHAKTALVIGPNGSAIVKVLSDATIADVTNRDICTIYIDLNRLVRQVDDILFQEQLK
jgi:hypothetical protein